MEEEQGHRVRTHYTMTDSSAGLKTSEEREHLLSRSLRSEVRVSDHISLVAENNKVNIAVQLGGVPPETLKINGRKPELQKLLAAERHVIELSAERPITIEWREKDGRTHHFLMELRENEAEEGQRRVAGTNAKVSIFHPEEWERYKKDLVEIEERCFSPLLGSDEEELGKMLTDKDTIVAVAMDNGKIIGDTYGFPVEKKREEAEHGKETNAFKEMLDKYGGRGALYVESFAVLPEYRSQGVGTELKRRLFVKAKEAGYKTVVGHANRENALQINLKFGAKKTASYERWFDTEETHDLYELDLSEISPRLSVPRVEQSNEYACGPASLRAVLMYYGKVAAEENIAMKAGTTEEAGTSHEGLIAAAEAFGMSTESRYDARIEDITRSIDKGIPVIVNYFLRNENVGHYSVVTGYDRNNLFIMDVDGGKEKVISKGEFEKDWFSKLYGNKWMLAVWSRA